MSGVPAGCLSDMGCGRRPLNHRSKRLFIAEVLKAHANDVCEGLVEGSASGPVNSMKKSPLAIHQRVGHLVRNDVVRQTREDGLTRQIGPDVGSSCREVAEDERAKLVIACGKMRRRSAFAAEACPNAKNSNGSGGPARTPNDRIVSLATA